MSHLKEIEPESRDQAINSLYCLEQAVKRLNGKLIRGAKTYKWYGRFVGDSPMPQGRTEEDLGKCEHKIKLDGIEYEIGVVKSKKHEGTYSLMYDWWDKNLERRVGNDAGLLMQAYQAEVAKAKAKQVGDVYSEEFDEEGNLIVELDVTQRMGY